MVDRIDHLLCRCHPLLRQISLDQSALPNHFGSWFITAIHPVSTIDQSEKRKNRQKYRRKCLSTAENQCEYHGID
jgi:hypothetical protein